jgi:FtsK/SpoIIIE family
MSKPIYIDRPPRIQSELPVGEADFPCIPDQPDQVRARLLQLGLPLITIIGCMLVSLLSDSGRSLYLLSPMALSVVASVAFSFYSFRKERRRIAEVERAYANRLAELNKEMHTTHDLQRCFYSYNYPDHQTTLGIVRRADRGAEKTERATVRLWERRADDVDFGVIRLGVGSLPSTTIYTLQETSEVFADDGWQHRVVSAQSWLPVKLGLMAGNKPRTLVFSAKRDGVHGMIAGSTGSGKSELLMTTIVSMALRYDPRMLNFVLVDYKDGGAFKSFEGLPHYVDMVTDLNEAAAKRMFTAISTELRRRQKLNAETGTMSIAEYRARGLHLTHAPYPYLFIIIDEFDEMIADSSEFSAELDRISRVGCSHGVNLVLASQLSTGVSDQMRANIKLRICLRVEGADTSRERLRRSDAVSLPDDMPGRGYLQVGNENIELIQVAYTGSHHDPSVQHSQEIDKTDAPWNLVRTKTKGFADHTATTRKMPIAADPILKSAVTAGFEQWLDQAEQRDEQSPNKVDGNTRLLRYRCGRWIALRRAQLAITNAMVIKQMGLDEQTLLLIESGMSVEVGMLAEDPMKLGGLLVREGDDPAWIADIVAVACCKKSSLRDERAMHQMMSELQPTIAQAPGEGRDKASEADVRIKLNMNHSARSCSRTRSNLRRGQQYPHRPRGTQACSTQISRRGRRGR